MNYEGAYHHGYTIYIRVFFERGQFFMLLLALVVAFLIFAVKKRDPRIWFNYYVTVISMHLFFLVLEYGIDWRGHYTDSVANVANGLLLHLIVASVTIHLCQNNKKWKAFYFVMGSTVVLLLPWSAFCGDGIYTMLLPIGLVLIGAVWIQRKIR